MKAVATISLQSYNTLPACFISKRSARNILTLTMFICIAQIQIPGQAVGKYS